MNLLNAAYGFLASADELQEVLVSKATADRVELVHSRYMRRWEAYVDQLGLARLTSPIGVTRAARRLEESLYDLVGACDRWNSAYLRGDDTEVHAERWERAFIDAADRRRDYVRAARMEFVEYGPGPAEDDEARQAV